MTKLILIGQKSSRPPRFDVQSEAQLARVLQIFGRLRPYRTSLLANSILPTSIMASRRLALNLNQALRNRAALRAVAPNKRFFATPINQSIQTESTTLSNGLTIATEHSPVRISPSNAHQKIKADFGVYSVGTNLNVSIYWGMPFSSRRCLTTGAKTLLRCGGIACHREYPHEQNYTDIEPGSACG